MSDEEDPTLRELQRLEKAQVQFNRTVKEVRRMVFKMHNSIDDEDSPVQKVNLQYSKFSSNVEVFVTSTEVTAEMRELTELMGESKVIEYNMKSEHYRLQVTCSLRELTLE
jgi:hypothetical protein